MEVTRPGIVETNSSPPSSIGTRENEEEEDERGEEGEEEEKIEQSPLFDSSSLAIVALIHPTYSHVPRIPKDELDSFLNPSRTKEYAMMKQDIEKDSEDEEENKSWYNRLYDTMIDLPVTKILQYVWKHDQPLVLKIIGFSFLLPPVMTFILPWWADPMRISRRYGKMQSAMRRQLSLCVNKDLYSSRGIANEALWTLGSMMIGMITIKALKRYVYNDMSMQLRMHMRRMVLEKILYSPLGSLERAYTRSVKKNKTFAKEGIYSFHPVPTKTVSPAQLERRMVRDLGDSTNIVFTQFPHAISICTRLTRRCFFELQWSRLHSFLVVYPFLFYLTREIIASFTTSDYEEALYNHNIQVNQAMSTLIHSSLNGLKELQIMSFQDFQMSRLNKLVNLYLDAHSDQWGSVYKVLSELRNHNFSKWLVDSLVERDVRWFTGMDHPQFSDLNRECLAIFRDIEKLYGIINRVRSNYKRQSTVKEVLKVNTYLDEEAFIHEWRCRELGFDSDHIVPRFEKIVITDLKFRYFDDEAEDEKLEEMARLQSTTDTKEKETGEEDKPSAAADATESKEETKESTEDDGSADTKKNGKRKRTKKKKKKKKIFELNVKDAFIEFKRGHVYGICGRNESGKSTFLNMLCKLRDLTGEHEDNFISGIYNDTIDFNAIGRSEWRKQITYISQRPFLFVGSIGANIHIGNPHASIEQVEEAARLAGVFLAYDEHDDPDKEKMAKEKAKKARRYKVWRGGYGGSSMAMDLVKKVGEVIKKVDQHVLNRADKKKDEEAVKDWGFSTVGMEMSFAKETDKKMESKIEASGRVVVDSKKREDKKDEKVDKKEDDEDDEDEEEKDPNDVYDHPMLNRPVQWGANNLSGGLRQSVALARLFLRPSASVVILDESFNSMDTIKKKEIHANLFKFLDDNDMTMIVISHNPNELFQNERCVNVLVFDHGKLIDQGPHTELIKRCQIYSKLCGEAQKEAEKQALKDEIKEIDSSGESTATKKDMKGKKDVPVPVQKVSLLATSE